MSIQSIISADTRKLNAVKYLTILSSQLMSLKLILVASAIGATAGTLISKLFSLNETKTFVSYRYEYDHSMRRLLVAWSRNPRFKGFKFLDVSSDISIDSNDENVIKQGIKSKMKKADVVLVLVGDQTHKSKWVKWEITTAKELRLPVVAVKKKRESKSPPELFRANVAWVYGFKFDKIRQAINEI